MRRNLVFLDTETTSLDRYTREAWDIGYIVQTEAARVQVQTYVYVDLTFADPMSLEIGHYYQRHPDPYGNGQLVQYGKQDAVVSPQVAARRIAEDFKDAIIIGAVPSFDEETLAHLLRQEGLSPTWHYHLVDIESMAAGWLRMPPPWDFDKLLASFGLEYEEAYRHTAIGDAQMVMKLYDAILKESVEDQGQRP